MSTEAQFWITCFITLFFIVDPFAAVPLFLSLTAKHGPAKRIRIARHASLWCGAILLVFAAAGSWILGLYGISLPALRTGGGIILLLVALDMVRTRRSTQETPEEMKSAATRDDISLTPLAMPILSGPGAISTVIVLMGSAHGAGQVAAVLVSVALVALLTYVILRLAGPLYRVMGDSGNRALMRLMGLLLAALAAQFILDGLKGWSG
jgi:multiple antibiotic resistance protein